MNIAFFVTGFPAISETFIVNQILALQSSGHQVHIFSEQKGNLDKIHPSVKKGGLLKSTFYRSKLPSSRPGKIRLLLVVFLKNLSVKNFIRICRASFRNKSKLSVYDLIHYLDKPEYDILHAHFGVNGNYVLELKKLGLYPHAKFITTFHGFDLNPRYKRNNFYKELFVSCHCFTVNTNYSRQLLENLGCAKNKIEILPAGFQTPAFTRKESSPANECIRLLFAGRLIPLKGPDRFIEIGHILKQTTSVKFTATIIGDGEMMPQLIRLIQQLQLQNVVHLAGEKTHDEVVALMNASDIFILPGIVHNNMAEAQGLVIQEAQAMQLPVLVSDAGGMAEGVMDGVTGFVLPQNDLSAFAEKIELLAGNEDLRKRMGLAGRKFVEAKYDSVLLNEQLLTLYQKK
ncbi:MAG TPA: glycosyltransferase [Chitinophagaceae bacterium]|nr:glycosyltransferase [Chitinophagaceae bacterium]